MRLLASGKGEELKPIIPSAQGGIDLLSRLVNSNLQKWCSEHAPKGFGWTSLQINTDTRANWHMGRRNLGPSVFMIMGEHVGGEFELQGCIPAHMTDEINVQQPCHATVAAYLKDGGVFCCLAARGVLEDDR